MKSWRSRSSGVRGRKEWRESRGKGLNKRKGGKEQKTRSHPKRAAFMILGYACPDTQRRGSRHPCLFGDTQGMPAPSIKHKHANCIWISKKNQPISGGIRTSGDYQTGRLPAVPDDGADDQAWLLQAQGERPDDSVPDPSAALVVQGMQANDVSIARPGIAVSLVHYRSGPGDIDIAIR